MTLILLYVLAALFVGWTLETIAPNRPLFSFAVVTARPRYVNRAWAVGV